MSLIALPLGNASHAVTTGAVTSGGVDLVLLVAVGSAAVMALAVLLLLPVPQRGASPKPRPRPLAVTLAALSAMAGAIHAAVVPEHLAEHAAYGILFLGLAVLQLGFADWLLKAATPTVLNASLALNATVAVLWLVSRTTGLPLGSGAHHAEAVGVLDVVCSAAEVMIAAGCLWLLRAGGVGVYPEPEVVAPVPVRASEKRCQVLVSKS